MIIFSLLFYWMFFGTPYDISLLTCCCFISWLFLFFVHFLFKFNYSLFFLRINNMSISTCVPYFVCTECTPQKVIVKWGIDNPDDGLLAQFVHSDADPLVRATQILAVISYSLFAESSLQDVVTGTFILCCCCNHFLSTVILYVISFINFIYVIFP